MSTKQTLIKDMQVDNCYPIGAVERDTGIARDTLRVWQRRYGFPVPLRNSRGERFYPAEQIQRLQRIRRLLDQGLRPGKIVPLSEAALAKSEADVMTSLGEKPQEHIDVLLTCLREHAASRFEEQLEGLLALQGLRGFVLSTVAPLLQAVGENWARGQLDIYEEHFVSQLLIRFLTTEIAKHEFATSSNPVLLATLPGEKHGIGLLMTAAVLASENIACINLGIEVPVDQLLLATEKFHPRIVGLTFSAAYPYGAVRSHLQELRERLPGTIKIWAGGHAMLRIRKLPAGVVKIKSFDDLPLAAIR